MNSFLEKAGIKQLQWIIWVLVYFIICFAVMPVDGLLVSMIFSLITTAFYAGVIYGNINFLFPHFYQKKKILAYSVIAVFMLLLLCLIRGCLIGIVYNTLSWHPMPITAGFLLSFIPGGLMVFLLSFVYRIALAYFTIKKLAEEVLSQKVQAELDLIKSQVQPHFLFNTLNNIYYEIYLEAPRSAGLIGRLSNIMRYFVDESPRKKVSIQTEIEFIENYIELERIRIRYGLEIFFKKEILSELYIPPMLLMTFVENIFKHGIDKINYENNTAEISLIEEGNYLSFQTVNRILGQQKRVTQTGFGISNLRKRLSYLYGSKYELNIDHSSDFFIAFLKIPLS
jgi:uncharacterized integral membrane protein